MVNVSAVFFLVAAAAAAASGADPPPTPPPAASFQKIAPGGATGCATGAPFSFFYRAGSVNKVVVEFQGGGACWSAATCAAPLFTTTAEPPKEDDQGIHSNTDARNPFRGWHHMFVPYCTGDIFAGNKTTEYQGASGNKFAIRHFGRANAQAALNYVFANAPQNPDVVATVGCSAGSLGGYINGPYVFDRYPKSRRFYFGDSFVGVLSTSQFRDGLENWDLQFSPTVTGLDRASLEEVANDPTIDAGVYIISATLAAYPKQQFASYTSAGDGIQSGFFAAGRGVGVWHARMRELISQVRAGFPDQYATFISPGYGHCRTQDDGMYSVESDTVKLSDWITSVVAGAPSPRNVDCARTGERECPSTASTAGTAPAPSPPATVAAKRNNAGTCRGRAAGFFFFLEVFAAVFIAMS
jgi:hypothetical protein